jgi:Flp pilus assembly pilin Flp
VVAGPVTGELKARLNGSPTSGPSGSPVTVCAGSCVRSMVHGPGKWMGEQIGQAERGQSLVEYSLLLMLVAVIVLGGVWLMGMQVGRTYGIAATRIGGVQMEPTPAITPVATPPSALWEDWYEAQVGGWSTDEERYCVYQHGEHRSFYGAENWTDYVIRLTANLYQGDGFGVFFRATQVDHVNGYLFEYAPGGRCLGKQGCFFLRKIVEGREQYPFAESPAPAGYQWHNAVREVEVRAEGDTYSVLVDGEEVLKASDSEYTYGEAGLRTWDGSEACFWGFTVAFLKEPDRDRDDAGVEASSVIRLHDYPPMSE